MKLIFKIFIFFLFVSQPLFSQVAPNKYRIYLKDKKHNAFSINHPEEFLSEKAINRRIKQKIQLTENDLPVSNYYIDSLKNLGFTILNKSKWLNTVTVYSAKNKPIEILENIEFIKNVKNIKSEDFPASTKYLYDAIQSFTEMNNNQLSYGESGNQIRLHNGHILHQIGYLGHGITIAVIDAGFYNVNSLPSFDSLWANNQIIKTYDFVNHNESVFEDNNHGMKVLSIIGGNIPGQLIGSAPKANFLLLRSEDVFSEYPIEEDNWASAAEYADSAGADIINTSLGYSVFDDPSLNYNYSDMNGNTAFVTKAADIAASKGILVVVSAGNEGNNSWKYILAPADGDSVLSVGAVNAFASYVDFSSQGPTYDGRRKPNAAAMGYQTILQDISGQISKGNGTSFSAPIISGLAACLWQALPDLTNMELLRRIEESSHQFSIPDYKLGYGIPDFAKAASLSGLILQSNDEIIIEVYPNPFSDQIFLQINSIQSLKNEIKINLFNILGEIVYSKTLTKPENIIRIDNLDQLPAGLYIIALNLNDKIHQFRVSKLR